MLKLTECLKRFEEFCELHGDAYEIDLEKVKSLITEKSIPAHFLKNLSSKDSEFNEDEQLYDIDLKEVLQTEGVSDEVKNFFRAHNATAVRVRVARYEHEYSAEPLTHASTVPWVVCCHIPDVDVLEESLFPGMSYKNMSPDVLSWLDAYQEWRSDQYRNYCDYLIQAGGYGSFIQRNLPNYVCQLNLEIGDGGSLYVWVVNDALSVTLQMY